ncbi:hypothetical protein [Breoghania sp.]|uniref:hypothetical protein n=1 Tax=Breoghania sp. TaxID=2065378 RepID=UPI00260C0618|nr:hypothetical protein [Breoghania sp.]MDJ0930456.1 hypothetical protein [Breoghania sp.]
MRHVAFHIFGRLFAIAFAYCLAAVAASFFLAFAVPGWAPGAWMVDHWRIGGDVFIYDYHASGEVADLADTMTRIVVGAVGVSVIGGLAFVPAGLAIVMAEIFRLRSILYHVLVAGLISIVLLVATWIPGAG